MRVIIGNMRVDGGISKTGFGFVGFTSPSVTQEFSRIEIEHFSAKLSGSAGLGAQLLILASFLGADILLFALFT